MSPYIPKDWADGPAGGTPILADDLDHLETQYEQAMSDVTVATSPQIPEIGLVPAVGFGHSYIASGSNQVAGTTFVHRLAQRQGMTYASADNHGAGGYRCTQMLAKIRAEWSASSRRVINVMCTLNDVGTYLDDAGKVTAAAALRSSFALLSALSILDYTAVCFDFTAGG